MIIHDLICLEYSRIVRQLSSTNALIFVCCVWVFYWLLLPKELLEALLSFIELLYRVSSDAAFVSSDNEFSALLILLVAEFLAKDSSELRTTSSWFM